MFTFETKEEFEKAVEAYLAENLKVEVCVDSNNDVPVRVYVALNTVDGKILTSDSDRQ